MLIAYEQNGLLCAVNFNSIQKVCQAIECPSNIIILFDRTNDIIGKYSSAERAKQVMEDLIISHHNGERVFCMPKE